MLTVLSIVAILDAGRNSMSFFMLLVVSLGLSVVRESLDRTMLKCQILAVAHFIFGGTQNSLPVPFLVTDKVANSFIRGWNCGTRTRINVSSRALDLRHPSRFHIERIPPVDYVCS